MDYRDKLPEEAEAFMSKFVSEYYFGIDGKNKDSRNEDETQNIRESWRRMDSARRDFMNTGLRREKINEENVQELNPEILKG